MAVIGVHKIEKLFKEVSSLRLDKSKVKEVSDLVDEKLYDLLAVAQENAKYNNRDVIWYSDVPLTKAFKESMVKFEELEEELELQQILEHLAGLPSLRYDLEVQLEQRLPLLAGTLLYITALIAKEFSQKDKSLSSEDLKKTTDILNLMI
jgi:histone H3/H4